MAMFLMRELPTREAFRAVARHYPEMYSELDLTAIEACYFLLRTGSDLLTAFEANLSRHGISQGRFVVLLLLLRSLGERTEPSKLAAQAGVTRATMTRLLDGLVRDGYVERGHDHGDRRVISALLTTRGRRILERIFPDYHRRVALLMKELSEAERGLLIRLLTKVSAGIPALGEKAVHGNPKAKRAPSTRRKADGAKRNSRR